MADHIENDEREHDLIIEETPIEAVDIDPSKLTPTSPEVISKCVSIPHNINGIDKRR